MEKYRVISKWMWLWSQVEHSCSMIHFKPKQRRRNARLSLALYVWTTTLMLYHAGSHLCCLNNSNYSGTSHNGLSKIRTASMQLTNHMSPVDIAIEITFSTFGILSISYLQISYITEDRIPALSMSIVWRFHCISHTQAWQTLVWHCDSRRYCVRHFHPPVGLSYPLSLSL